MASKGEPVPFLEPHAPPIARLSGSSIADPALFRERVRLNRAQAPLPSEPVADAVTFERLEGRNDLQPFYVLELGAKLGAAVCKLAFDDGKDGTGFLIGPDLLLTNNHVLPGPERARIATCLFDYQLGSDRKPREVVSFRLDPDSLFLTSDEQTGLDFTFVRIVPEASKRYGVIPASRGSFGTRDEECANIVQHAGGEMKQVAIRENRIVADSGVTIHYLADTLGGSSGSPVFNSDWQLIGLHHASVSLSAEQKANAPALAKFKTLNEAIKISAIASHLEQQLTGPEAAHAREVLRCVRDTDSLVGYFGMLGRPTIPGSGLEKVVAGYKGDASDIDIGFWNVEWLSARHEERTADVARIFSDLQLDIYSLSRLSPQAADHLARYLAEYYGLDFEWGAAEPDAGAGEPGGIVFWNTTTVKRVAADWPNVVEPWFAVDSRSFDDLGMESAHGRIFNRKPGLFRFRALNRDGVGEPFVFNLVPLQMEAAPEGAMRRRMAGRILSAAIAAANEADGACDWIVGGDINAELVTVDLATLAKTMLSLSAEDEEEGAMIYLKAPQSLIEHIFLSPNLARTYGAKDFFVASIDQETLRHIKKITDHLPILARLSLKPAKTDRAEKADLPADLAAALAQLPG
ncbi:MAG: trypsin-like peptidase domain-containing protein [Sphingomonas sp.]